MNDTIYCYCCRVHHPKEEMRRYRTRTGERWRCIKSIQAASNSPQVRDAFGQSQSRLNREAMRRQASWQTTTRKLGLF